MQTLTAIGGGLAALFVLMVLARIFWGAGTAAGAALLFIPLWLIAAAAYVAYVLYFYRFDIGQEGPMLLLDFGVPALVALILWLWLRPRN